MDGLRKLLALIFIVIILSAISMFSTTVKAPNASSQLNPSGIYYVDMNSLGGSCSPYNTGTIADPFCQLDTLLSLISGLTIDDNITIYVREGTYSGTGNDIHWMPLYTAADGTVTDINNYTLRVLSYPGEKVIIDGLGAGPGFRVFGSNIIIDGFEIHNFNEYAIHVDSNNFPDGKVEIRNNIIHDCAQNTYECSGIEILGGNDNIVEGNEIFGITPITRSNSAGMNLRLQNALVRDNTIHDNLGSGIIVSGDDNLIISNEIFNHLDPHSFGIKVNGFGNIARNNTLYDNRYNAGLYNCDNCTIADNLIYSSGSPFGDGVTIMGSTGAIITGNTIVHSENYGIKIGINSHSAMLLNNIIYGTANIPLKIEYDQTGISLFTSDHNLYHSLSGNSIYFMGKIFGSGGHPTDQYISDTGQDANSLFQTSPQFVDEAAFDFRPSSGSPACNASDTGSYIGALPCEADGSTPPSDTTICSPEWTCTSWSSCNNGAQYRNCYDWNTCGTNDGKPAEIQSCTQSPATTIPNATTSQPPTTNTSANITGTSNVTNISQFPTGSDTDITVIMPEINDSGPAQADEPVVVIENFTSGRLMIIPDTPAVIGVSMEKIGLKNIEIKVRNNVSDVSITVQRVSSAPVPVQPKESERIYQYLNITHENVEDADIDLITIHFDVSMDWINENNANISDIYLSRYVINQWVRLPTRIVNQTEDAVFFKALSPGLSMFSIMAGSVLSGSNRTCVPYDTRCVGNKREVCDTSGTSWQIKEECEYGCSETSGCLGSPDEKQGDPWTIMIIIIVVIIILAVLGFYFNSKREGLTKEIKDMQSYR